MLMRTDPFRELDRLTQQVLGTAARPAAMPMDAYRSGDKFFICLDLPGINPPHPGDGAGPFSMAPGLARGTAQLCLGQPPQIGLRTLAVHHLSILARPGPRSRSGPVMALSALI